MKARTTVVLLQPHRDDDTWTGEAAADWTQPPTLHVVPAAVEPLTSDEQTLTADTVVSRWSCHLPLDQPPGQSVDASWRVRWDGHDHHIDGAPRVWRNRRGSGYLECILKRITG